MTRPDTLRDDLITCAAQLRRVNDQLRFSTKTTHIRVADPDYLASLLERAAERIGPDPERREG